MSLIRFLTCASLAADGYFPDRDEPLLTKDDALLARCLRERGHQVSPLVWDSAEARNPEGDVIIVRSPWDYFKKRQTMLEWIDRAARNDWPLMNSARVLQWNSNKAYLLDLQSRGVPMPKTLRLSKRESVVWSHLSNVLESSKLVAKPLIGANAWQTLKMTPENRDEMLPFFQSYVQESDFLVQPFLQSIVEEGEWSLVYFGGRFSHGFLKRPAKGDFRVQEEHGGSLHMIDVPDAVQMGADNIVSLLPYETDYLRIDGVMEKGTFLLMEIEAFEPELYFRADPEAADRFSDHIESVLS